MTRRLCQAMGCGEIIEDASWCESHKPREHRKSASKRGYGSRWRRFRTGYLAEHPLCLDCKDEKRVTPAREIHHKIKLVDGGSMYDEDNLRGLCTSHHSARTNKGE